MLYYISIQVSDIFESKVVDHIAEVYVVIGCASALRKQNEIWNQIRLENLKYNFSKTYAGNRHV
jgi:hypothetical protein